MVKLTRISAITGNRSSMELPTTQAKLDRFYEGQMRGSVPLVQDFFPELNDGEREFVLSGITPKEWHELYPPCLICGDQAIDHDEISDHDFVPEPY